MLLLWLSFFSVTHEEQSRKGFNVASYLHSIFYHSNGTIFMNFVRARKNLASAKSILKSNKRRNYYCYNSLSLHWLAPLRLCKHAYEVVSEIKSRIDPCPMFLGYNTMLRFILILKPIKGTIFLTGMLQCVSKSWRNNLESRAPYANTMTTPRKANIFT